MKDKIEQNIFSKRKFLFLVYTSVFGGMVLDSWFSRIFGDALRTMMVLFFSFSLSLYRGHGRP